MHHILKTSIYFMVVALFLSLSPSLHAQGTGAPSQDSAGAQASRTVINKDMDDLDENHYARQEFREEMQKIREQHEELETQHDTLKVQCMDAKGQDRTACNQRFTELGERRQVLHERIMALHEKMAAQHNQHHARLNKNHTHQASGDPSGAHSPNTATSASTGAPSPSAQ